MKKIMLFLFICTTASKNDPYRIDANTRIIPPPPVADNRPKDRYTTKEDEIWLFDSFFIEDEKNDMRYLKDDGFIFLKNGIVMTFEGASENPLSYTKKERQQLDFVKVSTRELIKGEYYFFKDSLYNGFIYKNIKVDRPDSNTMILTAKFENRIDKYKLHRFYCDTCHCIMMRETPEGQMPRIRINGVLPFNHDGYCDEEREKQERENEKNYY